jgi:type IV secretory pathway VirB3-like protein
VGIRYADHLTSSIHKSWHNFADKRRSLGRYRSLADYKPRNLFVCLFVTSCKPTDCSKFKKLYIPSSYCICVVCLILKIFFFIASGVGLSPLYCGHFWPVVPILIIRNDCIFDWSLKWSSRTIPVGHQPQFYTLFRYVYVNCSQDSPSKVM